MSDACLSHFHFDTVQVYLLWLGYVVQATFRATECYMSQTSVHVAVDCVVGCLLRRLAALARVLALGGRDS